ncbi:epidermal growth factor receptor [Condylostylus longicornis]|uniref:epidermal growth factor receptor n=1 Tax=Condylostylus longicornis TaxID=2530218 RepID=UPI00244E365D|nr:epidermal growth factor receptor [Condylostylus longicornis]
MKGLLLVSILLINGITISHCKARERHTRNGGGSGGSGNFDRETRKRIRQQQQQLQQQLQQQQQQSQNSNQINSNVYNSNTQFLNSNSNNNNNNNNFNFNNYNNNFNNNNNNNNYNNNLNINFHNNYHNNINSLEDNRNNTDYVKGKKICIGTKSRLSVPSNRVHHYRNLRDRYNNCTYVDGNLELTWLQDENLDLSFLEHIREVTGYILFSHVDIKRVVLPRLQIIRGRTLFKLNVPEKQYALFVAYSKMFTLELPALRDILSGSVGFVDNFNLCHIKSINWKEIISDPQGNYAWAYNFSSAERTCPPCDKSCDGGCWGTGPQNCQKFSKVNCSPQCSGGRCFGPRPRECCHLFCAGGCTGPTQNQCIACKNFYDDGVCKQECPPMQKYNPTNYLWEANPEGKYAYGATCVKNCPEHLLKDQGACVRTCPADKTAKNSECVPCNGPCPKTCPGVSVLNSGNIDDFRGCTIIEGSLRILDQTFDGYSEVFKNYSLGPWYMKLHPDRLEVFSTVKEITGYLDIQGFHPDFTNLSYFRNLEVIHGRQLMENYFASFTIVKTNLKSLELKSLKRINSGSVVIQQNKYLCYVNKIAWANVLKSKDPNVVIEKNRGSTECEQENSVCHPECNSAGCWGSAADQCLECKHFNFNRTCYADCTNVTNAYQYDNKTCKSCHPECISCTGPGPDKCIECVNFRDGNKCVTECPFDKYNENGICQPCHPNCEEGCTGPNNTIGRGACNSCDKAVMSDDNIYDRCLHKNESCPNGYYYQYVLPNEQGYLKPLGGKAICRKCHPRCEICTGYGFHRQICQKCIGYKFGEQCEDECAPHLYADEEKRECFQCHPQCKGCFGPGENNCKSCKNFKVFAEGSNIYDNTTLFNCTEKCPQEYPYKNFEDIGPFCSAEPARGSKLSAGSDTPVFLISACVVLFLVFCALAVVAYSCRQKTKAKKEAVKMTMVLAGCEDSEPLRPSNVAPNLNKLRIVKEAELRKGGILGMGAFGRVYKGVWVPENENVKVPVAIKELLKCSGVESSKEFLDEAYVMASVEHPNLLKLLAVCMTSQMMLITQLMPLGCLLDYVRNNKDKIGSKALLNWSTQIARGMAYLEERHFVHRDLAARNVLVQTPSCVKITDFGLAKLLNSDNEYKAAGGKMPIKWLALECIRHRIFTSKSDVWAYGVTIWELLTYGTRPHDTIPAKDIPDLIEVGLKLEQPEICSLDIYCTLLSCWHLDAEMRPTFKQLVNAFAEFARDPGRYLVIPGDKFTRLPSYTSQDEKDLIRKLAPTLDGPEPIVEAEDYFRSPPKSSSGIGTMGTINGRPGPSSANEQLAIGDDGMPKIIRYCKDPMNKTSSGDDETDSNAREVGVGNLRLDLPVDEDDYLMPTCQNNNTAPSGYMDLIGVPASVDNPEYLMNGVNSANINKNNGSSNNIICSSSNSGGSTSTLPAAIDRITTGIPAITSTPVTSAFNSLKYNNTDTSVPTQTIGIPVVITSNSRPTSTATVSLSSSSNSSNNTQGTEGELTSSDHEYYNDLQRELQPLHKSETTV